MFNAVLRARGISDNYQLNGILKNCSRYFTGIVYKDKQVRIMHLPPAK
ncbi:hypothetical protein BH160DRAFT_3240 [Burkholderia sp. H160]|nr:hypothetical protein BH160DRAFT_3240 [Burkholderia sp. H160]